MRRAYLYRLHPTKAQEDTLNRHLRLCRWLWNAALEQRRTAWKSWKRSYRYGDQQAEVPLLREMPEFQEVWGHALQNVLRRLDKAFKAFFQTRRGYPRFKGRFRYNSLTYPDPYGVGYKVEGNRLHLSKIGDIKIRLHRPWEGSPKTLTVKRVANKWFAVLSCDLAQEAPPLRAPERVVGLDTGVARLATLSDGTIFEAPRPLKHSLERLGRLQRRLSRTAKRSRGRDKARLHVTLTHYRIAEIRKDAHFQAAARLTRDYDFVAIEDLNYKSWQRGMLSRAASDTAPGLFLQRLRGKAEEAGCAVVEVDARGTTQTCARCWHVLDPPLQLGERTFRCPWCGWTADRDINSAHVILALGLEGLRSERPEVTPVEMGGSGLPHGSPVPVAESGSPGL